MKHLRLLLALLPLVFSCAHKESPKPLVHFLGHPSKQDPRRILLNLSTPPDTDIDPSECYDMHCQCGCGTVIGQWCPTHHGDSYPGDVFGYLTGHQPTPDGGT